VVLLGDTLGDLDAEGVMPETLRRDQGGPERLIEVLAAAFVHELPVSWTGLLPGRHVDLQSGPGLQVPSRLTAIGRFRRSGGRISHVAPAAAPLLACGMRVRMIMRWPGLLLRGGSAVPQPESGQRQARECYQRSCDLKGLVV
jgi:hypothetical protein